MPQKPQDDALLDELARQHVALAKFGEMALRSDDLDVILNEACKIVANALGTGLAKVVELQADGRTLFVRAGVGWKDGVVGIATIEVGENTSEGAALKTGEPMISSDISTETRFRYAPFLLDNNVRAVSNVIILGAEGSPPFGILQVDSHQERSFSNEDVVFLKNYANLIGAAVIRLQSNKILRETNERLVIEAASRSQAEEELHQSRKMEAIGQLTGGLSHDFNNLLLVISGNLQFLHLKIEQGHTSDLLKTVDAALNATQRATSLTQRLLAFSRRQTLEPKITDLNAVVRGMENVFHKAIGQSIKMDTDLSEDIWMTLCDPNQLENVLLNLVINARDAMPMGGSLAIRTLNVSLAGRHLSENRPPNPHNDTTLSGEFVTLSISDTGTGMSPEIRSRAFEPFYTTKPLGQGTGLGLSMVHGFIKQSNGDVHLVSDEGFGTTVTIYLPRIAGIVDPPIQKERHPQDNPQPFRRKTILVVDDESLIADLLQNLLENLGHTVITASTGVQALETLGKTPSIDLMITDIEMPEMNGVEMTRKARLAHPGLKVLFITGHAENTVLPDDNVRLLLKPFQLQTLVDMVGEMVDG